MISIISQIPQFACTASYYVCAIPAIETAIRTIYYSGSLLYNYYQDGRVQNFFPDHDFTTFSSDEQIAEVTAFKEKILKDIEDSKLTSCAPQKDKPLILKLGNSKHECKLDSETFKLYSTLYRGLCENMQEEECSEFIIPNCSEMGFELLTEYLQDKSKLNLEYLNKDSLFNFYRLATYLGMSDLENRCINQMIYTIEHSANWEKIDKISNSINPENFKSLNQLILQVQCQKIRNIRTLITEYKLSVNPNILSTLLLGAASLNSITSVIGALSFMVFSRSHQKMSKNENLSVWFFNKSITVMVKGLVIAAFTLTGLFFMVTFSIIKVATTIFKKPIIAIPLAVAVIGIGGMYATKFLFNASIQMISGITSKALSAIPALGTGLFNAASRLVPAVLILSLQVASIAFNILVFVPRTILGV